MARPLHVIAADIRKNWAKVNYAAVPYLMAMTTMETVDQDYGCDSGSSIVLYFLSNARSFTGPEAKRLKAELKEMVK